MISEEDLYSLHQVSVQDLHKRSPGKICVQELYKSSLCADLFKRSLGKASGQDVSKRSPGKISWQAPSWQDFCMRCLVLCEPAQWKCTWTFHKRDFVSAKMAGDTSADTVLCEPAQSKCTWIFCKSHFVRKFTGKMPYATTGDIDTTSNEHPALTLIARTPSVWPHCLGKNQDFGRFCKKKLVVLQIWEWIRLKWKLHHPKHWSKEQRRSAEGFITRNYNHSLQISIIALAKQDLFWHFLESSPIDFIFS